MYTEQYIADIRNMFCYFQQHIRECSEEICYSVQGLFCAGRRVGSFLPPFFIHGRKNPFYFYFFLKCSVPTFYFCLCCNVICIPYLFICLICEKVFKRAFFSRIFILPHYICLQPFLSPYLYLSLVTLPFLPS